MQPSSPQGTNSPALPPVAGNEQPFAVPVSVTQGQGAPAPGVPVPAAPVSDAAVPQAAAPAATPSASAVNASGPALADDGDLIEKEWVAQVKQIVAATAHDPFQQSSQLTKLKADYMQKRYGKVIKLDD